MKLDTTGRRYDNWVLTGFVLGEEIRVAVRETKEEIEERRDALAESGRYDGLKVYPPIRPMR